ncbi:MAG: hypothetical protein LBK42_14105 [Propionibacteriaceae bacterium]|nr:hypothetical protein [Propionibacteriaceae bacterium]
MALVTVPEDFSRAATSVSGPPLEARRATIEVVTSDQAAAYDDLTNRLIVQRAVDRLSQQITGSYLQTVYLSFSSLHDGLAQTADGADQLADGTTAAVNGAAQLAAGAAQVAAGTDQLALGLDQSRAGAAQLERATGQLALGSAQLARGNAQLADAAPGLRQGLVDLNSGLQKLKAAGPQLRAIAQPVHDQASQVAAWAESLSGDAGAQAKFLAQLAQDCADSTGDRQFCARLQDYLKTALADENVARALNQFLDCLLDTALTVDGWATDLNSLADGLDQAAAGSAQLVSATKDLVSQTAQLAVGAAQAASGAAQVAAGATALADGLGQLGDGAYQAASGAAQVAAGTAQLADQAVQLEAGMGQLADGVGQARDAVPDYSAAERDRLKDTVSQPVTATAGDFAGAAPLSLYASLALWLGSAAVFLVTPTRPVDAFGSRRGGFQSVWRCWRRAGVWAVAQGGLIGLAVAAAARAGLGQSLGLVLAAVGLGLSFTAVAQALALICGGPASRVIVSLATVVAIAPAVVSALPPPVAAVAAALPSAPGADLIHAILGGPANPVAQVVALAAWLVVAWAASTAVLARDRNLTTNRLMGLVSRGAPGAAGG